VNELRNLASDGSIADFIEQRPGSPRLDMGMLGGVSLRLDEYWLSWHWHRWYWQHVILPAAGPSAIDRRAARVHHGDRYDFAYLPDDWSDYCYRKRWKQDAHPVAVVAILRTEMREGIPDAWPRFVGNHPVIYEYRPEAVLQAISPGDSVTGATTGTLGGYLWRPSDGQHFALSCAHVFGEFDPYKPQAVYAGSTNMGRVVDSHFPPVTTGACNNRISGLVIDRSVDAAVADLSGAPSIALPLPGSGKVTAWTPIAHLSSGDQVTIHAQSGRLSGKVKECNIWKELTFKGNTYCFGDLLVIEDTTHHYIASQFTKPGDSGAWVVSTGAGYPSWDAMLVAGDGANAYCSYAENVMAKVDPTLALPP
jgi:hypothetical protein